MVELSRVVFSALMTLGVMDPQEEAPQVLVPVRERLRPGSAAAYGKNELKIAAVCARLRCPHPYLALVSVDGPDEVWWLNAFTSREEKDQREAAYARNQRLMAQLRPLARRKEALRQSLTTMLAKYRADGAKAPAGVERARFSSSTSPTAAGAAEASVLKSSDGQGL